MKIKTTFAALAMILAPGLALAQGCSERHMQQEAAVSCAAGTTLDTATGKCVPVNT
jgi:hypothetical protein